VKKEREGEGRKESASSLSGAVQESITAFWLAAKQILDGLVVMIRLSHSRERGSIPRRGKLFFRTLLSEIFDKQPTFPP
jgi:hypothetical protein